SLLGRRYVAMSEEVEKANAPPKSVSTHEAMPRGVASFRFIGTCWTLSSHREGICSDLIRSVSERQGRTYHLGSPNRHRSRRHACRVGTVLEYRVALEGNQSARGSDLSQ